ncbi:uncharacterized protein LOC128993992 [Macrosteles quadrilineatus]|uniref:uncharacterized protein LOC128993992 n=1 Tax=Macrosteles quadrilineatus TaxID=74068 RepID=UPI0023E2ED36|nr:uncharacterized protein LOC128993992 [Macrosteles quadrilineatus]
MDPYLLTRIGDVTIQRVLPKQDQPIADNISPAADSPTVELDLSMKPRSSMDKGEDEGGGDLLGEMEGNKESNFSDSSEESDISEEMDEDEQDAPLSLVTNRRDRDEATSENFSSVVNIEVSKGEGDYSAQEGKPVDFSEAGSSKKEDDPVQTTADDDDDDDMPLSRLMAESENMDELSDAGEFDIPDDKIPETLKKICEGEFEDSNEPEEDTTEAGQFDDEEADSKVKEETEQDEEEQEDPDREMIVVKQEVFEEGDEESGAKRKATGDDGDGEGEDGAAKKKKESGSGSESGNEDDSQSGIDKKDAEKKLMNLRKNIREVMDETQLDEATLNAQRQEMERLRRVQEQQRIIREVNRQINLNRQNTKTQTRVISLLQGGGTSLLKASPSTASASPKNTSPNTVLVKLSSGSGPPQVVNKKVLEILKSTKSAANTSATSKASALANKLLNKPHSLTPSVSIAPVKPGLTISKVGKTSVDDDKAIIKKTGGKMKKEKGKDVVMISSSSSDEDDCILISGGEEEEEEEEDPTNSGMHTNDLYNVPDDQGRVLINVGRPENEPEVFLAPQIARIIKPHQIGGVRFLFDNVVESLERFKTSTGFGCILAHSMGLGKTLQVVSFCDVFLRYTEGKTVLCIMPINTLQNWLSEFNMWLPVDPASSPYAAQGDVQPRTFPLFVLNDMQKSMVARAKVVIQWAKEGGVLLIGYELYRQLSLQKARKRRVERKRKLNPDDDIDDEKNKHLLEEMHAALVKPGPDLVICDEGHRIKNSHASISQALKQIRSKRRVVLTGYPLQNNLLEYWCMVDFVRPNYLGTKTEFSNMFERPIQNGQCIDSTPQDIRLMRYRAHVLHSLLEGFVQRRSHSVLTNALPQKEEYVILVRMTNFQRKLYDTFMNEVVRTKAVPNPLKAFAVCCKIWNHPDVLYHFLKKRNMDAEAVDLDLEEAAAALATPAMTPGTPGCPIAPVAPTKRGRGRSPKGTSPKRERKVNPRKRGGADTEPPGKSPMVAAVMPNTTNSNQQPMDQTSMLSHSQQSQDTKPLQPFSQQQSSQFRPNFPYNNSNNNQFPPAYSGMNQNYPNFNPQQQGDFHNMPPPYPGFHNQQGFNNQNMYGTGFGSNYYPSQQDSTFGGSNYWNNQFFNNDPNSSGMFPNFSEGDANNSNFYNQEMMGADGFNHGNRSYNSGLGVNRPGMSGMNPMQHGRMGMNNPSHGMMGMNSNMSGMNMNNMGMPGGLNSMSGSNMSMSQNNFGMNQGGSHGMNTIGQSSLGMSSHGMSGMGMGQSSLGMNHQSQGMGVNQITGMGVMGSQGYNNMNVPSSQGPMSGLPGMSQNNPISSGMSNQSASSGSMQTMTNSQVNLMSNASNQSSMESQQQAAIENIANNLMMSSQQTLQAPQGLLGGGENSSVNQSSSQPPQNSQSLMNPQHHSSSLLGDMLGNSQGTSQNLMGGIQNQQSQLGNIPQTQVSSTAVTSQNQPNMMPPLQGSHMMANMISSSSSTRSITSQHDSSNLGSMQGMGGSSLDNQNMMGGNHLSQTMLRNSPSSTVTSSQQNVGNMQNQQGLLGSQSAMDTVRGSMFRNPTSNQSMFSQQNMGGSTQGMFNTSAQPLLGSSQSNMINQNMLHSQPNISASGNMSGFDQASSQNLMSNHHSNMMGAQDQSMPSGSSLSSTMTSQQNMPSAQQDNQMFGNQSISNNPMSNLQSMLNNQNMMGSQSGSQSFIANKRPNDNLSIGQQNAQGNQSGMMMNHPSGMTDQIMHTSQQHSMSTSMDSSQQNMFGMNHSQTSLNPIGQSGFMSNPSMLGPGMGNSNLMSNQTIMGSQSMGMNNPHGMYSNNQMNPNNDIMGGNTGMIGNQINNPSFNPSQMGSSNNMMGLYNQPGMMNYPGVMGNQINNIGMMNQSSMSNQNPPFGNNMMRNPSPMMGIRNPQSAAGVNPDINQGSMTSNFTNQNNFGAFGNSTVTSSSNLNPNQSQDIKAGPNSFPSTTSSNLFMSGGEFHTNNTNSQTGSQNSGNISHNNMNNDYNNYNINEDQKMWDDIASKCGDKPLEPKTENEEVTKEGNAVKKESEISKDNQLKLDDKSFNQSGNLKSEEDNGSERKEKEHNEKEEIKSPKAEGDKEVKEPTADVTATAVATVKSSRGEDAGIPYDWATELLKDYIPGNIEASAKFALFFCILEESMSLGDRVLVFSQSLFTLNLIEDFLQRTELPGRQERWARNWNYYRLDGSTGAMEREKLINEFNSNPNIHLFLVSTRAGSLGINLVGANRVVVLDASWNPCHDTQAVCRVYRYGQRKPCFVYRLVTDNCLEKKIYDRQINKQGMADRVVDECNPDAHLSIKEVTNLCWDNEQDSDAKDFSDMKDKYIDVVMQKMLERYSKFLSKEPFQHESLLVDRKDKKLSQAEKRLAKRSYELEKQAANNNTRPTYGYYPGNTSGVGRGNPLMKPMASVRPMQAELNNQLIRDATSGRPRQWIPAEVWQKQGMSAQEMTLPLDVVIPTNSPDRSSIVLKAGQKVMVLKSPKGIYMQLENGKIIAIRTAFKVGGKGEKKGVATKETPDGVRKMVVQPTRQRAPASLLPLRNNSNISIIPRGGAAGPRGPNKPLMRMLGNNRGIQKQPIATAKPYFGEGSAHPPVTVTVTKKKIGGNQTPSTSTSQVDILRDQKQVTVTPIPPPSPKKTESTQPPPAKPTEDSSVEGSSKQGEASGGSEHSGSSSESQPSPAPTSVTDEF